MSEPRTISAIGQIAMRARDLDRAVRFYRDTLGLRFLFTAPPHLAFFDCDGVRLMLGVPEDKEFDHPGSVVSFRVEDIGVAYRTLQERGVVFQQAPERIARLSDREVWVAAFQDTEGNTLALLAEPRIQ